MFHGSHQFFELSLFFLPNSLFFDIPLLYYHINLRSLIIYYLFFRYISFFWYLSVSFYILYFIFNCFWAILWLTFWDIRHFISNFITNLFTSGFNCFLSCSFEAVLIASVTDYLAWSEPLWRYWLLTFLLMFLPIFLLAFWVKWRNTWHFTNIQPLDWT